MQGPTQPRRSFSIRRASTSLQALRVGDAEQVRVSKAWIGENFADQGHHGSLVAGRRGSLRFASCRKQLGFPRFPFDVYNSESSAESNLMPRGAPQTLERKSPFHHVPVHTNLWEAPRRPQSGGQRSAQYVRNEDD